MAVCFSFLLFACGGGGDVPSAVAAPSQLTSTATTLTLSASSNSIAYNGATTISWASTNTSSCSSSGGGGTGVSGSFGSGSLTNTSIYTVTCTGPTGLITRSTTVNVAPPVVVGCSMTGATAAINLSNVPSRLTGVAPLSVFFDAAGTTATSTTKPFHDLEYRWDFGDAAGSPVSGSTWKYGARANVSSRNAALGPQAAHVFETPGTYAITLTATDGSNTVSDNCVRIVVQDPNVVFAGTNTVCFSTAANFANCPTGASRVQTSNFAQAVNSYKGSNKRLLFRRGESFTSDTSAAITVNGPGIIGAFGNSFDPKPVVVRASSRYQVIISAGSASTPLIGDWRIMDLDLNGQNIQEEYNVGIDAAGMFNEMLALRMTIRGTWRGIAASHWALAPGKAIYDGWSIADSTMTGIVGCTYVGKYDCDWRIYIAGKRHAIQGNSLDNENTGGSHVIRSEYMAKGVIENNNIARAGIIQHAIKLHAWAWGGGAGGNSTPNTYTEQVIIADNKIVGGVNPWTVAIEPQNDQKDERVRDVIVERNWFTTGSGTQIGVNSSASNSSFRNNIFQIGSSAANHTGILVTRRGVEAIPNNVAVYNNTFYSSTGGDFVAVQVGTATGVTIKNNLGSAPSSTSPLMVSGIGAGAAAKSNNSSDSQVQSVSPGWVVSSPINPVDFALTGGSYASGAGTAVPVYSDFTMAVRSSNDLGALKP